MPTDDTPLAPSAELRARVFAATRAKPAPTRGQTFWRWSLAGFAGAALSAAIFVWAEGVRPGPRPDGLIAATSIGAAIAALIAAIVILGNRRAVLGPRLGVRVAVMVGLPLVLFIWKIAMSAQFSDMMVEWPERPGLRCLGLGTAMALGPFAAMVFVLRRTEPNHPRALGMSLGVIAAGGAWVLTDLWCPVAWPLHLLLGHVLPMVLLAALGAGMGRWLGFGRP